MHVRRLLDRWGDPVLGLALGAGMALEVSAWPRAELPAASVLAAATGLLLAGRRRFPLVDAVLVAVATQAVVAVAPRFQGSSVFLPAAFVLSLYSLGRHARGVAAWLGVPVVLATVVLSTLDDGTPTVSTTVFFVFFAGLPWAVGLAIRLRVDRVTELRARAAALEEETRRAIADERIRIARELHDVVSHAIAVTVLQARGGRRLVGRDDEAVRAALEAVERTNTAALGDMRRLLAVLRDAEESPVPAQPRPTIERVADLAEQVRTAGLPVDLGVEGTALPVPAEVDLVAYRVAQEGLTNALKHGATAAAVRIRWDRDGLRVDVESTGRSDAGTGTGGRGLTGLRERVAAVGGSVDAGPTDDGWRVSAVIPYLEPAVVR